MANTSNIWWSVKASGEDDPPGTGASCGPLPSDRRGYSVMSISGVHTDVSTAGQAFTPGSVWPCGIDLNIRNPANGKTVTVHHVDNGAGSDAFLPTIGIYPTTRTELGLAGGSPYVVHIQRADGKDMHPLRATQVSDSGLPIGTTSSSSSSSSGSTSGGALIEFPQKYLDPVRAGVDPQVVVPPVHDKLILVTLLTNPETVKLHTASIAAQMHAAAANNGYRGPRIVDFTEAIVDVTIETSVQGASTLEVTALDPFLSVVNLRDRNGNYFIDTDSSGMLLPMDINFPLGSDCMYRLVNCKISTDVTAANLTLQFEDLNVSLMRNKLGPVQSYAGELLATFIQKRVSEAGVTRFVEAMDTPPLTLIDPSAAPSSSAPASSHHANASAGRINWQKIATGTSTQVAVAIAETVANLPLFGGIPMLQSTPAFSGRGAT